MFWKKKPKSKFIKIKEEIDSHLLERRLSAAMALFNDLYTIYGGYDEKDKDLYRHEYFQTKTKLTLLMKIEELLQIVKTDDLKKLKERLNEVEVMTNEEVEEIPQRLYNYINHHYNQSKKVYLYKLKKQELDKIIKKVHDLLTEQNYDIALKLFPDIMKSYNEVASITPNDELFEEIQELKAHIKMSLMKQHAYTDEAETDIKNLRIFLDKKEKAKEKVIEVIEKNKEGKQKLKVNLRNVEPSFKKLTSLRDAINKGDVDKSKKQFFKAFDE
jgi:hypothetical protein